MKDKRSPSLSETHQQDMQVLQFLETNGIDPMQYVAAGLALGNGLELPGVVQNDLVRQSLINAARPFCHKTSANTPSLLIGDVVVPTDVMPSGVLISGATGSGKTSVIHQIIDQCYEQKRIRFWDVKGEARRLHLRWRECMTFSPSTAPWLWMKPPPNCPPLEYFIGVISEIRNEFDLRSETYPLAYTIYERMTRGLKQGGLWFSWSDARRVFEHEAVVQRRENLATLARVFLQLETVMGEAARLRSAPDFLNLYGLIGLDFVGQDPAILRLFLGLHLNRLIHASHSQEHTTELQTLEIIDEASPICGKDIFQRTTGTINSLKRFATLSRFTGTSLIIGTQNISQLDPYMKNAGTKVVFCAPSVEDAEEAAKMLGLPREAATELMRLGVGDAYVRSVGWPRPVKTHVPWIAV